MFRSLRNLFQRKGKAQVIALSEFRAAQKNLMYSGKSQAPSKTPKEVDMSESKEWIVLCPRCGSPLEEKTNLMSEKVFLCHTEGCDYKFRSLPNMRVQPQPDPRRTQSKGI